MAKYIRKSVFFNQFTDLEYHDLRENAAINASANNADKIKAAKINKLMNFIDEQKVIKVQDIKDFGAYGILVSEGIISPSRRTEIEDAVDLLDD